MSSRNLVKGRHLELRYRMAPHPMLSSGFLVQGPDRQTTELIMYSTRNIKPETRQLTHYGNHSLIVQPFTQLILQHVVVNPCRQVTTIPRALVVFLFINRFAPAINDAKFPLALLNAVKCECFVLEIGRASCR